MAESNRREREQQRRRAEILSAALTVFAAEGFHGTTMAAISRASEYPLGTIYKFFQSKEQIYHDLIVDKARQLEASLVAILERKALTPLERLRGCLQAKARFFRKNREYLKLFLAKGGNLAITLLPDFSRDPALVRSVQDSYNRVTELYAALFQEGIDAGVFRPLPARELATLYIGVTNAMALDWLREGLAGPRLDEKLETAFNALIGGIFPHAKA